jgi:hypothetical protein
LEMLADHKLHLEKWIWGEQRKDRKNHSGGADARCIPQNLDKANI